LNLAGTYEGYSSSKGNTLHGGDGGALLLDDRGVGVLVVEEGGIPS